MFNNEESSSAVLRRRPIRTAALPMAFTAWEFWRGALWAWAWFGMLFVAASVVDGVVSWAANLRFTSEADVTGSFLIGVVAWSLEFVFFGLLFAIPALIAATTVFLLVAYLLGLVLRRISRRGVHLLVFTVLGVVVSAATTAAIVLWWGLDVDVVFLIPFSVAAAAAVPLGWLRTATLAFRGDAAVAERSEAALGS